MRATKYQISKHLGLPVLLELFGQREGHTYVTLIILETLKILVSRYQLFSADLA